MPWVTVPSHRRIPPGTSWTVKGGVKVDTELAYNPDGIRASSSFRLPGSQLPASYGVSTWRREITRGR